jgi:hypothetical protein
LARYQENCAEARHLTTLLERTTAMVAQTSGVLLGLMGFSGKGLADSPVGKLMPAFFILLGLWGVVSTMIFEARVEEHRRRTIELMKELEPAQPQPPRPVRIVGIWVFFHACIAANGVVLYVVLMAARDGDR